MSLTFDKILVTGASGSMGKQLLYELQAQGHCPIAHVRAASDTSYIDRCGLEKRVADLRQDADLAALVEGVDAIIHTAAWVNFRQDRLTQFTGINTMGAVNLFKAAQTVGVKRYVHVSTVAAVGAVPRKAGSANTPPTVADEEFEFNLGHLRIPYIMTKRAAENELAQITEDGPTDLVTVNPSVIVAPSRSGDDHTKARQRFGKLVMPDLPNRINLVDIRDVARGVLSALHLGRPNQRYILAGDNITGRDLVLDLSCLLGRVPHLIKIPRVALNVGARMSVILSKLRGRPKLSFYPDIVRMFDFDWAYSSMKARRELDYKNRSLQVTMGDLLNNKFHGTHMKP